MENSKVEEYWQKFKSKNNINSNRYEAWQFGFDADLLGELVLEGKKTATAGALKSYQFENVDIPRLGQYNIVLDSKNQPLCIIRTIKVEIIPFLEASSEHAYKDGENDRTLESWRNGHKRFFINEFREYNIEFSEDIEVVCEGFEVVYR